MCVTQVLRNGRTGGSGADPDHEKGRFELEENVLPRD